MKHIAQKFIAFISMPLFSSCGGIIHNGIEICDKKSDEVVATVQSGEYREMACRDVRVQNHFFTVTRENRSLIFKKRDKNGQIKKSHRLPLLNSVWVAPYWFSVSPSGDKLVYWKDASWVKGPGWEDATWAERDKMWVELPAELRVRSFKDNRETVIFRENEVEGHYRDFLAWSDKSSVVYVKHFKEKGHTISEVRKIGMSGSVRMTRTHFSYGIKMSPTGRYLSGILGVAAIPEPDWKKGDSVGVFDLQTMKIIKTVNTGIENAAIHTTAWNEKGNMVAFSVGVRGEKAKNLKSRYFSYNLDINKTQQDGNAIDPRRVNGELFDYMGLVWILDSGRYVKSY